MRRLECAFIELPSHYYNALLIGSACACDETSADTINTQIAHEHLQESSSICSIQTSARRISIWFKIINILKTSSKRLYDIWNEHTLKNMTCRCKCRCFWLIRSLRFYLYLDSVEMRKHHQSVNHCMRQNCELGIGWHAFRGGAYSWGRVLEDETARIKILMHFKLKWMWAWVLMNKLQHWLHIFFYYLYII